MLWKRDKLFCEMNPLFYLISEKKEQLKRFAEDAANSDCIAKTKRSEPLPCLVANHRSVLIKKGKGIDPTLQEGKAVNIELASAELNGLVIHPGEVFSFWKTVGNTTKRKGYQLGRIIEGDSLKPSRGGGLCNLAHTISLLVLHSPLDVMELHLHSDALAPDQGERVPFATGTSINYNNLDYRFKNNTDQDVQLLLWCEGGYSHGELRSEEEFPWSYSLVEEDHHFEKEGDKYYSVSRVYRNTLDKATGAVVKTDLIVQNHSEVMYDHAAIPQELVRG